MKFRSVAQELTMYVSKKVLYSFLENRAIDQLKKYDGLRCYLFEWKMDSKPLFVAIVKSVNGMYKTVRHVPDFCGIYAKQKMCDAV